MKACHHCARELQVAARVGRTDGCPHCHSDLKCCLNCRLHEPGAHNQCLEPQSEWVGDKDKANFCEFFEFRERARPGASGAASGGDRARDAFDALFSEKR